MGGLDHDGDEEDGGGRRIIGEDTLCMRALEVSAQHLEYVSNLDGVAAPVVLSLLSKGLTLRSVHDGNIHMFLKATSVLDLSDALHLSDVTIDKCLELRVDLVSLILYKASSFSPQAVCKLVSTQHNLRELILSRCGSASDALIELLPRHCPQLRSLDLTRQSTLSVGALGSVRYLSGLERLVLYSCTATSDSLLITLATRLTSLRHLSLARCGTVSDAGVAVICRTNPGLQDLIVSYCRNLTDSVLDDLKRLRLSYVDFTSTRFTVDGMLDYLGSCGAHIRILYLSFCAGVNKEVAKSIGSNCAGLERLYLSRQPVLGDEEVIGICKGCPQLEVLNVSSGISLTDATISCMAAHLPRLHTLYLSGNDALSVKSMEALAVAYSRPGLLNHSTGFQLETCGCRSLITPASLSLLASSLWGMSVTALDFTSCDAVTDESLIPMAAHCVNVIWLSLSRTPITDRAIAICGNPRARGLKKIELLNLTETGITDAVLPIIVGGCFPRLTKLYLANCNNLGSGDVMRTHERTCALEALFISYSSHLSDDALLMLLGSGKTISCLMATRCMSLTDQSVARLPILCPALTLVDLSHVGISDVSLFSIAENSRYIGALVLSNCTGITSVGVIAVLRRLTLLRSLILSHCSQVDDSILGHVPTTLRMLSLSRTGCTPTGVGLLRERLDIVVAFKLRKIDKRQAGAIIDSIL